MSVIFSEKGTAPPAKYRIGQSVTQEPKSLEQDAVGGEGVKSGEELGRHFVEEEEKRGG